MASIINASNSGFGGIVSTGDSSGELQLQTAGTTALTINTSQNVGIGTSSPSGNLFSGTTGGTIQLRLGNNTGANYWGIGRDNVTTGDLVFQSQTTERMRIDSSGNLQFNSGYGSVATAYGCRAWVNFNGTGTPAIRASGNVTSITDNGTGNYTVNFTTAMTDANYSILVTTKETDNATVSGDGTNGMAYSYSTSSVRVLTASCVGTMVDPVFVNVAIFR